MALAEEAIRQQVAQQQVPLRVVLVETEVTTLNPPPAVYVMASRCSYLPAVAEQLLQHFQRVLPPGEHTPWFDHCGVPLKWHIPIGVLYDILHTERSTATPLPWELTVHYRSFPSQELITCDDVTTPRSAFVNSLKEAAFALTGSSSAIMNWLGRLEDTWRHVQDGNVAQCLSEMAAFNLHPSLHAERKTRIPMRVMITKLPPGMRRCLEFITFRMDTLLLSTLCTHVVSH